MNEHPIKLVVGDDLVRSRLTVFFRLLLAIPHFIWLLLWSIVALLAAIANWVATLVTGRPPAPLHRFLAAYVKYVTQLYAYIHLIAEPYPPFDGQAGYPVDVTIAAPAHQNRWSVGFRAILLIPAALIAFALVGNSGLSFSSSRSSYSQHFALLAMVALLGWFAGMVRGRMPHGLRDAGAYALSYGAQFWAYVLVLTDRYPDSDPQAALSELPLRADPIALELDGDLRRSRLTVFFRLLLAIPHLVWLQLWGILALLVTVGSWFATLFAGRSPGWAHRFLSAYLRYQFHVYSFLYLIANPFPGFVGRAGSYPLEIVIGDRRSQNRWKTGFRLILVIPALMLAAAYGTLVAFVALLGWFSSLVRARMPLGLRNAGALALRYHAQTLGYLLLLTDSYPYGGPVRDAAAARVGAPAREPGSPGVEGTSPGGWGGGGPMPDVGLG